MTGLKDYILQASLLYMGKLEEYHVVVEKVQTTRQGSPANLVRCSLQKAPAVNKPDL